jgi:hypothetical protein
LLTMCAAVRALGITFVVLFARKCWMGHLAVTHVQHWWPTLNVESFTNNTQFQQLLVDLRQRTEPPAIFILNQYALKMTDNFLCNTQVLCTGIVCGHILWDTGIRRRTRAGDICHARLDRTRPTIGAVATRATIVLATRMF